MTISEAKPWEKWTPEQDDAIRALAVEGKSAREIAAALNVTRNAVIGRAKRKGIALASPQKVAAMKRAEMEKRAETIKAKRREGASLKDVAKEIGVSRSRVWRILEEVAVPVWDCEIPGRRQCHWPEGDLLERTLKFCGAPLEEGQRPYCTEHHKLAYVPVRVRRRSDERERERPVFQRENMRIWGAGT